MRNKIAYAFLLTVIFFIPVKEAFSQGYNVYDSPGEYRVPASGQRENVLIILDCSLSMEDEVDGQRKIDVARDVINKVLARIPGDVYVGLRVYGHKRGLIGGLIGPDDCEASELLVPINPNNRQRIYNELLKLRPVGMTPICYSIGQSVEHDFIGLSGKKRIILVSDGMENCNGSPCEFAVELVKKNVDVSIDVIGFDLSANPSAMRQLRCAALVTKGKFYTADNPDEFLRSMQQSFQVTTDVQGVILKKAPDKGN